MSAIELCINSLHDVHAKQRELEEREQHLPPGFLLKQQLSLFAEAVRRKELLELQQWEATLQWQFNHLLRVPPDDHDDDDDRRGPPDPSPVDPQGNPHDLAVA